MSSKKAKQSSSIPQQSAGSVTNKQKPKLVLFGPDADPEEIYRAIMGKEPPKKTDQ